MLGLSEGETLALGETDEDIERLTLGEALGLIDAEGLTEGLTDGLIEAEGIPSSYRNIEHKP